MKMSRLILVIGVLAMCLVCAGGNTVGLEVVPELPGIQPNKCSQPMQVRGSLVAQSTVVSVKTAGYNVMDVGGGCGRFNPELTEAQLNNFQDLLVGDMSARNPDATCMPQDAEAIEGFVVAGTFCSKPHFNKDKPDRPLEAILVEIVLIDKSDQEVAVVMVEGLK